MYRNPIQSADDTSSRQGCSMDGLPRATAATAALGLLAALAGCSTANCLNGGAGATPGPAVTLERGHLGRQSWQLVAWEQGGPPGPSPRRRVTKDPVLRRRRILQCPSRRILAGGRRPGGLQLLLRSSPSLSQVRRLHGPRPRTHDRPHQSHSPGRRAADRQVLRHRPARLSLRHLEREARRRSRTHHPFQQLLAILRCPGPAPLRLVFP